MSSNTNVRQSQVPGVADLPEVVPDAAIDFEPEEASETQEDPGNAATGDGGDPFPIPGSGPRSKSQ